MAPLFDNELCATDNIEEEASSNNPSSSRLAEERRTLPSVEELKGVIHFLATTATDTLVEIILQKR
jgi:hypothetical protein